MDSTRCEHVSMRKKRYNTDYKIGVDLIVGDLQTPKESFAYVFQTDSNYEFQLYEVFL